MEIAITFVFVLLFLFLLAFWILDFGFGFGWLAVSFLCQEALFELRSTHRAEKDQSVRTVRVQLLEPLFFKIIDRASSYLFVSTYLLVPPGTVLYSFLASTEGFRFRGQQ